MKHACHFDRKNLSQQILEWRNLAVSTTRTNGKISPLRSFLASVEMTHLAAYIFRETNEPEFAITTEWHTYFLSLTKPRRSHISRQFLFGKSKRLHQIQMLLRRHKLFQLLIKGCD